MNKQINQEYKLVINYDVFVSYGHGIIMGRYPLTFDVIYSKPRLSRTRLSRIFAQRGQNFEND